jgi:hypothetical protein
VNQQNNTTATSEFFNRIRLRTGRCEAGAGTGGRLVRQDRLRGF